MLWTSLVSSWLRQTARQKVQEIAMDAARRELTAKPVPEGQPPTEYDVGLVFALGIEAGGLVDRLSDVQVTRGEGMRFRCGQLHGKNVALVEAGAGSERAARGAQALIDAYRPHRLISAGFCGALEPGLRRNMLLIGTQIVDAAGHSWAADPASLPDWLGEIRDVRMARLFQAEEVVCRAADKLALGEKYAALGVDMESLSVAEVATARSVPLMAVRVVSDEQADELPPDIQRLLMQKSNAARAGAALGSIFHRFSSAKDLLVLNQRALEAAERLGGFLAAVIKHL